MSTQNLTPLDRLVLIQLGAPDPVPERLTDYDGSPSYWAQTAVDAANHGASGGFPGFTYYNETVEFTAENWKLIMGALREDAGQLGCSTVAEMVSGFTACDESAIKVEQLMQECASVIDSVTHIRGQPASAVIEADDITDDITEDHTTLMNLLAWYALEEAGHRVADLLE